MSQEAVPGEAVPDEALHDGALHDGALHDTSAPDQEGAPKGLLQQMEELMAALNADLTQLDADLQQPPRTSPPTGEDG